MHEKLRFAIIGCGRIAPRHAQSLAELSDRAQLVAVADVIESRAQRLARDYGAKQRRTIAGCLTAKTLM